MEVVIYWSEQYRGGLIESHTTPYPTDEGEWAEYAVKWERVSLPDDPAKKYALVIAVYDRADAKVAFPRVDDGAWSIRKGRELAYREAESYEGYMAWVDDSIDMITVDGNLFFKSSRFADKD